MAWTPFNLVNLLLYFEGFEVVEFRFMRLEFGVELVFAALFLENMSTVGNIWYVFSEIWVGLTRGEGGRPNQTG